MAHHCQAIHPERFQYKFHPLSPGVLWVNFTYKTYRGEKAMHRCLNIDAKHRVSTNILDFGSFFLRSDLFPFVEWEIIHAYL
jgi:hypothetical protein